MELEADREVAAMMARPEAPVAGAPWIWNGYSLAERDRRWRVLRERAQQAGLDCLVVPLGDGTDARYFTQLAHAAVVLPTDGRPPIVVTDWPQRNEWVPEPRYAAGGWGTSMAEALIEAGMERGCVGVAGMKAGIITFSRSGDGSVNHAAFAEVQRRLPNARFSDATDIVGLVRWVKSDEEWTHIRRAVAIAEAAIDEIAEVARPGVDGDHLYGATFERMLALGCEHPGMAVEIGPVGKPTNHRATNPPIGKRIEEHDYILAEVNAMAGSQGTQEEQHFVLGRIPDRFKAAEDLLGEVFSATSALIKPGNTVGDLIEFINSYAVRRGEKSGLVTRPMLKGGGYGEDGPRVSPMNRASELPESLRELRFEVGALVVWKPDVYADDMGRALSWGGAMRVTEQGAEFVGRRPLGLMSIGQS
ncbi:MAG: family metallopeptidase [Chloroflexi bacterium]|nr:family metallopeptidase [Chloroflexota bacterium]